MLRWFSEHTGQALTVIGLAFYGGALLVYSQFYGVFGVEPEEAGVDYKTALVRAVPDFLSWIVSVFIVVAYVVFVVAAVLFLFALFQGIYHQGLTQGIKTVFPRLKSFWKTGWARIQGRTAGPAAETDAATASPPDAEPEKEAAPTDSAGTASNTRASTAPAGTVVRYDTEGGGEAKTNLSITDRIVLILAGLVVAFFWAAVSSSHDLSQRVQRGEEIRPSKLFPHIVWWPPWKKNKNDFDSNPLRIRVEHVVPSPAPGQELPKSLQPSEAKCGKSCKVFAYLGRAGDTIVLYELRGKSGSTLRVPAAEVLLSNAAEESSDLSRASDVLRRDWEAGQSVVEAGLAETPPPASCVSSRLACHPPHLRR